MIIYFDSQIKSEVVDKYPNCEIFRDHNFNIKSVNYYGFNNLDKLRYFGYLNENDYKKIKNEILALNPEYKFNELKYFTLGKIKERKIHPKSEKLFILTVDFNSFESQIITNTTYTLENKYFFFCQPGSITAKGLEILKGQVMNEQSDGMLCSAESLGLTEEETERFQKFLDEKSNDNALGKDVNEILNI
ncbi:UNVERIFIED_CONTAM: hypothetical protein O8I53_05665 [Campylobacter lari]